MKRLLASLTLVFGLANLLNAQQPATGMPAFSTVTSGPDVTNLGNLNVHLDIPVLHKAGRGTHFTYDLSYDGSVWYPSAGTWLPVSNWGWRGVTEALVGYITYKTVQRRCFQETG